MTADYLAALGATLQAEQDATRVRCQDKNVIFPKITPSDLRPKINEAMHTTVAHYTRNVAASGIGISSQQILEVSIKVVLSTLYMYNLWRATNERYKDQRLTVDATDLAHPYAHWECGFYCEKRFGQDYARYAAALIGVTLEQFAHIQAAQRRHGDR